MTRAFEIRAINEISRAIDFHKESDLVFTYSPTQHSEAQALFNKKRFESIQTKIPEAIFQPNHKDLNSSNELVFAWDAHEETKFFQNQLADKGQNRLFEAIHFEIPNSFTGFRKKVEPQLPDSYENAIKPIDSKVLQRIEHYFYQTQLPSTYFETRNGMVHEDDSSRFSAYLSCGALDVRFLYNEIKSYEARRSSNKSTYWLVFELLWREFFYWHYQSWGQHYFSANGIQGPLDFTNYPIFSINELKKLSVEKFWQASLNELETTGFQTNRTRQLFASFWIHELKLNWRSGAHLFEENLIDYDVFSNWGNWMYLAGVGADPRGSRRFNIVSQLEKYDPKGEYFRRWL